MSAADAYVGAWLQWTQRASARWSKASQKIKDGTYEPKHLMSDALATWVTDPMEWWQDVASMTGDAAASVLIDVKGVATNDSSEFRVPNADQAEITALKRLGGTEEIPKATAGPRVSKTKKSETSIAVSLAGLDATIPAGLYVGFVYGGSKLLAHVIALR